MIISVPNSMKCMETFDGLDFNATGKLNICELETAVHSVWPSYQHKSAIMRAYHASDVNNDGFIGRNEFELFLRYLCFYNNLWFQSRSNDKEKRLYKKEFTETATKLSITNVEEAFDDIDVNNKGYVLFEEFCTSMAKKSLNLQECQGGSFRFANAGSTRAFGKTRQELFDKVQQATSAVTNTTYLTRLVLDFKCTIDFLHGEATDEDLEAWAISIHECMSNVQRAPLMGIDTMFEISHGADPIQMIAIYFSNVVSFEMDGGRLCRQVLDLVQDILFMLGDNGEDYFALPKNSDIPPREHDDTRYVNMVMTVFGVKPGQSQALIELDAHVKDKLLASIVAVRLLKDSLTLAQLAKVVVCIEATIPFSCGMGISDDCLDAEPRWKHTRDSKRRKSKPVAPDPEEKKKCKAPSEKSHLFTLDDLHDRLQDANVLYSLGLTPPKVAKAIQRAADVVNRFYGVFASTDLESYLTKLWGLLPQFNAALRQPKLYTIGDFHMAVKNLQRLVRTTSQKDDLFVSFRGVPDEQEVARFQKRFQQNSRVGELYIECKTVSCSIIAAFAELSGGDVPFCFLAGDSIGGMDRSGTTRYISDQSGFGLPLFTSDQFKNNTCHGQEEMYRLLSNAIHDNMEATGSFDVTSWRVTAFVYGMLGEEGIEEAMQYTKYPMNQDQARALLSCLPLDVVLPIGQEIGRIAVSRTDKVQQLLEELSST